MKLVWRSGNFCIKECYYITASAPHGLYTLSRARVAGVWKYALWCDKQQIGGIFDTSEAAKAAAQEHANEQG